MNNLTSFFNKFNIDLLSLFFILSILIGFFYNYTYYNLGFGFNIFDYLNLTDIAMSWISNENILIMLVLISMFQILKNVNSTMMKTYSIFSAVIYSLFLYNILISGKFSYTIWLLLTIIPIFISLQWLIYQSSKKFKIYNLEDDVFNSIVQDYQNLNLQNFFSYIDFSQVKLIKVKNEDINNTLNLNKKELILQNIDEVLNILLENTPQITTTINNNNLSTNNELNSISSMITNIRILKHKINATKKMLIKNDYNITIMLLFITLLISIIFSSLASYQNKFVKFAKFVNIELAKGNEKELEYKNLLLIGITSDYTIVSNYKINNKEWNETLSINNQEIYAIRNSDLSYIKFVELKTDNNIEQETKTNNIEKLDSKKVYFTDASFIFNPELEKNNTTINEIIDEIKFNHYNYHYVINIIGNANSKEINKSNTSVKDNYLLAEARAHNIEEYLMDNLLTKNINLKNISINSFSNSNQLSESTQENINKQRNCEIKIFKYKI